MGIDIDAFLEDFDKSEVNKEKEDKKKQELSKNKDKNLDLNFDTYVKEKFDKLQESVSEEDFDFLVKAYSEIKKFDNSLPSKLLELNKSSGHIVNNLGQKYSDTFLSGITLNKNKHGNFVATNLAKVSQLLSQKKVTEAIEVYNQVTDSYKKFPKEFILEKIELGKKLREVEIKINTEFEVFWNDELKKIKQNLSKEISTLKQNLVPGKIEQIEENLHNINMILESSPKIFYRELLKERVSVSKIIILAEDFLKKQYQIEFDERISYFNQLFERFHKYQIKKDVDSALTCYDEMLYMFEKMPDAFIDKKVAIYKKINNSFEQLNNLMLTSNINRFMETYSSSKIISQAREYINHAKYNLDFDESNLISIKKDLDKIPENLEPEKIELEIEINNLLYRRILHKASNYLHESFEKKKFDLNELTVHKARLLRVPVTFSKERDVLVNKITEIINRVENYSKTKEKLQKQFEKTENTLQKSFEKSSDELKKEFIENKKELDTKFSKTKDDLEKSLETTENKLDTKFDSELKTNDLDYHKDLNKELDNKLNVGLGSNVDKLPSEREARETLMPKQDVNINTKNNSKVQNDVFENLIDIKKLNKAKLNKVNLTMIDEINENYEIISNSSDLAEVERLKKKINFYVSLLPIDENYKKQILSKLGGN